MKILANIGYQRMVVTLIFMMNGCHYKHTCLLFHSTYPERSLLHFRHYIARYFLEGNREASYKSDAATP